MGPVASCPSVGPVALAGAHGIHSFIVLAVRVDAAGAGSAGSVKRC